MEHTAISLEDVQQYLSDLRWYRPVSTAVGTPLEAILLQDVDHLFNTLGAVWVAAPARTIPYFCLRLDHNPKPAECLDPLRGIVTDTLQGLWRAQQPKRSVLWPMYMAHRVNDSPPWTAYHVLMVHFDAVQRRQTLIDMGRLPEAGKPDAPEYLALDAVRMGEPWTAEWKPWPSPDNKPPQAYFEEDAARGNRGRGRVDWGCCSALAFLVTLCVYRFNTSNVVSLLGSLRSVAKTMGVTEFRARMFLLQWQVLQARQPDDVLRALGLYRDGRVPSSAGCAYSDPTGRCPQIPEDPRRVLCNAHWNSAVRATFATGFAVRLRETAERYRHVNVGNGHWLPWSPSSPVRSGWKSRDHIYVHIDIAAWEHGWRTLRQRCNDPLNRTTLLVRITGYWWTKFTWAHDLFRLILAAPVERTYVIDFADSETWDAVHTVWSSTYEQHFAQTANLWIYAGDRWITGPTGTARQISVPTRNGTP